MTDNEFGRKLSALREQLRARAAYVLRGLGDPEDLASQAILQVWAAWKRGAYVENGLLRHYSLRIVSNLAYDWLRHESRVFSLDEPVSETDPRPRGEAILGPQDVERDAGWWFEIIDALSCLDGRWRRAMVLRMLGYSQVEIADALGLSVPGVEAVIHRARERVRAHYSGVGQAPRLLQGHLKAVLEGSYTLPTGRCRLGTCPADHDHAIPLTTWQGASHASVMASTG